MFCLFILWLCLFSDGQNFLYFTVANNMAKSVDEDKQNTWKRKGKSYRNYCSGKSWLPRANDKI